MIEVRDLSFSYGGRPVLEHVSFQADEGEFLSVLGANGVGKSTLFRCMIGLLPGYTGQVSIHGRDARTLSPREMARLVAYIPQSTRPSFHYSVEDIVLMGTTAALGSFRSPGPRQRERAEWAMEKMGIGHLRRRCFHRTSGGEQQLAIIARALAQEARVLLLDEPTASLDFGNQMLVLSQARELSKEGYTILQTTHDPGHAYLFSDRVLSLKDGRVLKLGTPGEVLDKEVISRLYDLEVEVSSLYDDRVRVCTPSALIRKT